MKLSAMPRHFLTLRNGHQFVATVRRLGIPYKHARGLGKAMQVVRSPQELVHRRRLARRVLAQTPPPFVIGDGYVRFSADDMPYGREAMLLCQKFADSEKASFKLAPGEKDFLRILLSPARLKENPEFLEFATSPQMVSVVSEYLGAVPVLADVKLWWSVASDAPQTPAESQRFHRDHEDFREVKVFVHVQPVTQEAGPFTFLPASVTKRISKALGNSLGRFDDAEILGLANPDELISLTGPEGEAAMVDTASCFHYGSRNQGAERLVLMLHFISYHSIVEASRKVLTEEVRSEWSKRGPVTAALMRERPWGMQERWGNPE